ncbi:MAG: GNAT family N-acetyltransferase [Proteobacteria bacterium]|nr:GNAT family N-acetyltransferase [Pseudomonadota bacterium]
MMQDAAVSITWVSSADAIPAELWEQCFPPLLEGRWWYAALERSGLEDQFSFLYALLMRADVPIGIAPAFLMDVPLDIIAPPSLARLLRSIGTYFPRLRYIKTFFIGSPCSDEGAVGLISGVRLREVAAVLQDAACERARVAGASAIVWKDFPDNAAAELDVLRIERSLFKLVSYPGTIVPRLEGSFEGYLKTLNAARRNNLKRKLKRSRAMGALDVSFIQHPEEPVLEEIFNLFWQTYLNSKTSFERLTRQFFRQIAGEDVSHFILLRMPHTGKLAAFMLCFRLGSRVINKFIGLDYAYARDWYLYFRLWEEAVDWATKAGAAELQSGQTGYMAKLDLGHKLVPLTNYCMHRNPFIHRIFAFATRYISWSTLDDDLEIYLRAHDADKK